MPMSTMAASSTVGTLLRDWRRRRGLSQLDLALDAEVSARHLSFVETGRARPSPELLLHVAEHLQVPLRERNTLLLAAGYAPMYRESSLDALDMAPVRAALEKIIGAHEPFPAIAVGRHWNIVHANRPALAVLGALVSPELLKPPVNALRVSLHPEGLAPHITNFAEYSNHLMLRLRRQAALSADPGLEVLYEELAGYPGVARDRSLAAEAASLLFVPLALQIPGGPELRLFSTIATFGTALDITVSELSIEQFFPADEPTAEALQAIAKAFA